MFKKKAPALVLGLAMLTSCSKVPENDFVHYYPYVIDVSSGTRVTNARMLEMLDIDPEDNWASNLKIAYEKGKTFFDSL